MFSNSFWISLTFQKSCKYAGMSGFKLSSKSIFLVIRLSNFNSSSELSFLLNRISDVSFNFWITLNSFFQNISLLRSKLSSSWFIDSDALFATQRYCNKHYILIITKLNTLLLMLKVSSGSIHELISNIPSNLFEKLVFNLDMIKS